MSVSLAEVIEAGGYDLTTVEDSRWLVATQSEYAGLIETAEAIIEKEGNNE
jgi:hypothetical protein